MKMIRVNRALLIVMVLVGFGLVTLMYVHQFKMMDTSGSKHVEIVHQRRDDTDRSFQNTGILKQGNVSVKHNFHPDGKTIVYRHNGKELERLHNFCTWTLPLDCASLKTPGGSMPIYIHDVEDDPGLSGVLKKTGIRDPENVQIIINELKKDPEAGFLDFGSHIGVYALSIAHVLGRSVVAVDPMVENTVRLCKSIQKNKLTDKMMIVYNALSNEHTKVRFQRVDRHIGATKVMKSSDVNDSPCEDTENYSVMLDDIIPIVPFKTAVMKLDVEKSEYLAIQGGQKFLQEINVRSILMEWYNIVTTPHAKPLVDLLKKLKYVPYIPYATGEYKVMKYGDYHNWQHYKNLLDILWVKED